MKTREWQLRVYLGETVLFRTETTSNSMEAFQIYRHLKANFDPDQGYKIRMIEFNSEMHDCTFDMEKSK